jgi:hypothetical protein
MKVAQFLHPLRLALHRHAFQDPRSSSCFAPDLTYSRASAFRYGLP